MSQPDRAPVVDVAESVIADTDLAMFVGYRGPTNDYITCGGKPPFCK